MQSREEAPQIALPEDAAVVPAAVSRSSYSGLLSKEMEVTKATPVILTVDEDSPLLEDCLGGSGTFLHSETGNSKFESSFNHEEAELREDKFPSSPSDSFSFRQLIRSCANLEIVEEEEGVDTQGSFRRQPSSEERHKRRLQSSDLPIDRRRESYPFSGNLPFLRSENSKFTPSSSIDVGTRKTDGSLKS